MEHALPEWNETPGPEVRGYGRTEPRSSVRGVILTILALALLIASCGGDDKPAAKPDSQGDGRTPITFVTKSGKKPTLYAEIAQTIPELNVGLSKRPSDAGPVSCCTAVLRRSKADARPIC